VLRFHAPSARPLTPRRIQPVGSQAQTGISIAGHTWTLWSGPNSNWHVYSFVSASGNINSFSADLNLFFRACPLPECATCAPC
jgi:hypothetical protein